MSSFIHYNHWILFAAHRFPNTCLTMNAVSLPIITYVRMLLSRKSVRMCDHVTYPIRATRFGIDTLSCRHRISIHPAAVPTGETVPLMRQRAKLSAVLRRRRGEKQTISLRVRYLNGITSSSICFTQRNRRCGATLQLGSQVRALFHCSVGGRVCSTLRFREPKQGTNIDSASCITPDAINLIQ